MEVLLLYLPRIQLLRKLKPISYLREFCRLSDLSMVINIRNQHQVAGESVNFLACV